MKQMVIQLFEIAAAALVVVFCLSFFLGQRGEIEMKAMVHQLAVNNREQEPLSENGQRLKTLTALPSPEVRTYDSVYEAGEKMDVFSYVWVKTSEGQWTSVRNAADFSAEVLEIYDKNGIRLGKDAFHDWEQDSDEIIVPISYISETGELCFYQSGSYTLKIRITGPYGRATVKLFRIPVESG